MQLQRGRARAGAEIESYIYKEGTDVPLQRGRARAGAEMANGARDGLDERFCFNGAAPARARKYWLATSITLARIVASTGPRPRGRGNTFPFSARWLNYLELQRGRARAGAEITVAAAVCEMKLLSFNGAAPARARKYGLGRMAATPERNASTGPRPRGRGNKAHGK